MIFRPEMVEKILAGKKTQTRRPVRDGRDCRYIPNSTYAVQPGRGKQGVTRIRIVAIRRERLRELTEDDAKAEGFESVTYFARYWHMLYGDVDWDRQVWVISFEREHEEPTP